ncbi:MAG: HlyD family efflux transporter periplasmic adaptor subunit [Fuerstiella sp.]
MSAAPVTAPAAVARRPRGRLLIALLMLLACGGGIFTVWDSLLRYQAYGVVTGKIIDVSAPIDGVLKYVHVREGEEVRQDGRLATVSDLEYEQRLSRVADELKVAQASLHAEIAKVQWQSHVQETEMTKSMADFFESASQMYQETATLGVIRNELSRTQALAAARSARDLDLQNQTLQEQAHTDKLESIQKALKVLKERAETAARIPRMGPEQIAPLVAKVDMLLNETERIREWIAQGDLRAPVNGIVLARHHPAGECVRSHEPLFSVMEESSLEIELFLPQQLTADYKVGDTIRLKIDPFDQLVPCTVTAIGVEHRQPPQNIEVFYRSNVRLLPIRLRPAAEFAGDRRMTVGAVARMPQFAQRG